MLLYPAMKDLLKNVPSRYLLVNLVAARARKISSQAEQDGIHLEEKPVTLAIQEVANDTLGLETAETADGVHGVEQAENPQASVSTQGGEQAQSAETNQE